MQRGTSSEQLHCLLLSCCGCQPPEQQASLLMVHAFLLKRQNICHSAPCKFCAAAGVIGPCNPAAHATFWDQLGPGSWLAVLPRAGHGQFANISNAALASAVDLLCGAGSDCRSEVAHLTAPVLAAWMLSQLRPDVLGAVDSAATDPLARFFAWIEQQKALGEMQFDTKQPSMSGIAHVAVAAAAEVEAM